jgi:hypothetical protein
MKNDNNNNKDNLWVATLIIGSIILFGGIFSFCQLSKGEYDKEYIVLPIFMIAFGVITIVGGFVCPIIGDQIRYRKIANIIKNQEKFSYPNFPLPDFQHLVLKKYNLLDSEPANVIYNMISKVTKQYNQKNNTSILTTRVAELFFHRLHNDVSEMTIEDLKNRHFGVFSIIVLCCIIAADKEYVKLQAQVWKDLNIYLKELCPDNTKEIFSTVMDDCYIDLSISHFAKFDKEIENTQDDDVFSLFDTPIGGDELVDKTMARFHELYKKAS